jgi:hypothetical protein
MKMAELLLLTLNDLNESLEQANQEINVPKNTKKANKKYYDYKTCDSLEEAEAVIKELKIWSYRGEYSTKKGILV